MSTIYTVTQINNRCKNVLESQFTKIWIKGEVSKPQIYSSGHLYFTLKDDTAQISCVYFNFLKDNILDGDEITVNGNITLYSSGGRYQLIVFDYFHSGKGLLFKKFNDLKEKLLKEGLFKQKYKKQIPLFPKNIGIITSAKGSVIKDIINILNRRAPYINIYIRNCQVQGNNCSNSIINSLSDF